MKLSKYKKLIADVLAASGENNFHKLQYLASDKELSKVAEAGHSLFAISMTYHQRAPYIAIAHEGYLDDLKNISDELLLSAKREGQLKCALAGSRVNALALSSHKSVGVAAISSPSFSVAVFKKAKLNQIMGANIVSKKLAATLGMFLPELSLDRETSVSELASTKLVDKIVNNMGAAKRMKRRLGSK